MREEAVQAFLIQLPFLDKDGGFKFLVGSLAHGQWHSALASCMATSLCPWAEMLAEQALLRGAGLEAGSWLHVFFRALCRPTERLMFASHGLRSIV